MKSKIEKLASNYKLNLEKLVASNKFEQIAEIEQQFKIDLHELLLTSNVELTLTQVKKLLLN